METTDQIGVPEQAIAAFEQAIARDPHAIDSYEGLGWLYISKLRDFRRAIETFERGLAANPAHPLLAAYLGSTYARMGQMEKAIEIIEQIVKEHPDLAPAHSWLSYLYLRRKRWDEAAAACKREMTLQDAHSPHRVLGLIHHLLGRSDLAIAELERAVELDGNDYEARAALAKLYRKNGNIPAAEYQYKTGLEISAQDHEYGQASFYAVYGEVEKALELLERPGVTRQVSPGWLHIDPELVFIQDEERFQALVG